MSWLRRLFGKSDGVRSPRSEAGLPRGGPAVPAGEAKAELLRLLRERGARSALIAYDGGNDEGGVSSISTSAEPLGAPADEWSRDALAGGEEVELLWGDWSPQGYEAASSRSTDDERLLELAEAVVCEKWGSFAGQFEVEGRLVVDVDAGRIVRQDVVRMWDEEQDRELPPERETEVV